MELVIARLCHSLIIKQGRENWSVQKLSTVVFLCGVKASLPLLESFAQVYNEKWFCFEERLIGVEVKNAKIECILGKRCSQVINGELALSFFLLIYSIINCESCFYIFVKFVFISEVRSVGGYFCVRVKHSDFA